MQNNLESKFERVENHLVGIWRFRERKEKKKWAATYFVSGNYYDIYPVATIEKALDLVHSNIMRIKNNKSKQGSGGKV